MKDLAVATVLSLLLAAVGLGAAAHYRAAMIDALALAERREDRLMQCVRTIEPQLDSLEASDRAVRQQLEEALAR